MEKLKVLELFAGIGGFSLGLERTGGFETVAFCEIDPFCQKVLKKHWPEVPQYDDVRTLTGERLAADGIAVDVITGGFPCQDISVSGNQEGINDRSRSGLWSEIIRLACEIRPKFVIVENVSALLSGPSERPGAWFGRVLGDLAALGYDAEWHCIPAGNIGAPHERDRVWIVAYSSGLGLPQSWQFLNAIDQTPDAFGEADTFVDAFQRGALPFVCGRHDGLSKGVPLLERRSAVKAYGNAVVPQIPEIIGRAILAAENRLTTTS